MVFGWKLSETCQWTLVHIQPTIFQFLNLIIAADAFLDYLSLHFSCNVCCCKTQKYHRLIKPCFPMPYLTWTKLEVPLFPWKGYLCTQNFTASPRETHVHSSRTFQISGYLSLWTPFFRYRSQSLLHCSPGNLKNPLKHSEQNNIKGRWNVRDTGTALIRRPVSLLGPEVTQQFERQILQFCLYPFLHLQAQCLVSKRAVGAITLKVTFDSGYTKKSIDTLLFPVFLPVHVSRNTLLFSLPCPFTKWHFHTCVWELNDKVVHH